MIGSSQDNDNVTPLHAAVYNGKRAVVKELIKANADLNTETKFGNTPLHLACMEKWFVIGKANLNLITSLLYFGPYATAINKYSKW